MIRLIGFQELLPDQAPDALLQALQPAAHVVYSGGASVSEAQARALHVHALLPNCRVLLRLYGDNDQSGAAVTGDPVAAAQALYAAYKPLWKPGFTLFTDNEPGVNALDRRVDFWVALMDAAGADGIPIGYAAFSEGTPDIPDYARLLPAFRRAAFWKAKGVNHVWTPHGYFDPNDRSAVFDAGFYWHVDRPRREARAACLAAKPPVPVPDLVMTELGIAVGYDAHRGYKSPGGLGGREYAERLVGFHLSFPSCIFSAGAFGGWENFNVLDDPDCLTVLLAQPWVETQEDKPVTVPTPTEGGETRRLTKIPGSFVNVRNNPDGMDIGDLLVGDVVTYYPPPAAAPGWSYVVPITSVERPAGRQKAIAGWVSLQSGNVEFSALPVPTPTPTPTPPGQTPDVEGALNELNFAILAQIDADKALSEAVQAVAEAKVRVENAIARLKGELLPAPAAEATFPAQ